MCPVCCIHFIKFTKTNIKTFWCKLLHQLHTIIYAVPQVLITYYYTIQPSPQPSTVAPVTFEDESGDTNYTFLWFDVHAESLGLGAITVIASIAFIACLACCCLSCRQNCCWPCTFTFRQCQRCCTPKDSLPLDDGDNEEISLDGPSTPRRRSPVSGRRGHLGNMTVSSAAPFKKIHSRPLPEPRRHRYTARNIFQDSPPSRHSMILERHTYNVAPPGSRFDTGINPNIQSTNSTLTKRGGGHHPARDNHSLGPIGTLRDANGHLYSVVSADCMNNSRSHLSLPIDPIYNRHDGASAPHVDPPAAPKPTRTESLLSLNSTIDNKELNPRQQ